MTEQFENSLTSKLMNTRVTNLRNAFCRIQEERMQDVPLLNLALTIATVGFEAWEEYFLGVLITPWMMKLVGLPMQTQSLAKQEVTWQFPSGEYDLLRDELPEVGAYYSVSLFSPMGEFSDQAQAVATATSIMQALFEAPPKQHKAIPYGGMDAPMHGMSRRELLFGMFRSDKAQ